MMNNGLASANDVDQKRRQHDLGVDRPGLRQRAPEPAADVGALDLLGAPVEPDLGPREQGVAGIALGELGERQLDRAATGLGHQHPRLLASQELDQDAGAAPLQKQDAGQREVADLSQRAAHQAGAEAGAGRRPGRQIGGQAAVLQRQARLEDLGRGRPLEQLGERDQAGQQWIIEGRRPGARFQPGAPAPPSSAGSRSAGAGRGMSSGDCSAGPVAGWRSGSRPEIAGTASPLGPRRIGCATSVESCAARATHADRIVGTSIGSLGAATSKSGHIACRACCSTTKASASTMGLPSRRTGLDDALAPHRGAKRSPITVARKPGSPSCF